MTKPREGPWGDPVKLLAFAERLVRAQGDEPTAERLALVIGVTDGCINRWKASPDTNVKLATVDRIATRFGRHYSEFCHDDVLVPA